jgi:hypothetical protein
MYNTKLKEKLEIRALAVDYHHEGRRPFFTKCQERLKESENQEVLKQQNEKTP